MTSTPTTLEEIYLHIITVNLGQSPPADITLGALLLALGNAIEASAGGGGAGAPVVRAFPFAFDTPNILTGAALYTPTIGDILLDAWIEIDTAWDGTTPLGDVGTFAGESSGFYGGTTSAVDMKSASRPDNIVTGVLSFRNGALAQEAQTGAAPTPLSAAVIGKLTSANPIKVCVSQDGTNTGADPGSTQGAAVLYLVTATPA